MNKILVVDVTYKGEYKGQVGHEFCPLFPIKEKEMRTTIETKFPELKGKDYKVDIVKELEIKEYKKFKIYRKA